MDEKWEEARKNALNFSLRRMGKLDEWIKQTMDEHGIPFEDIHTVTLLSPSAADSDQIYYLGKPNTKTPLHLSDFEILGAFKMGGLLK